MPLLPSWLVTTAHIGMFGVFANDQSEEQYDPAVQALPTHVDSSPLFPTINNGPNTRVSLCVRRCLRRC